MNIDSLTLLISAFTFSTILMLFWLIAGFMLKTASKAAYHFSLCNGLYGVCVALYIWRSNGGPTFLGYVGSDLALLFGFFFLRRANQELTGLKKTDMEQLLLLVLASMVAIPVRYLDEGTTLALISLCIYGSYSIYHTAREAYHYMIRDFPKINCIMTLLPLYMMCGFFAFRVILALIIPSSTVNLLKAGPFVVIFLIVGLIGILGFNGSGMGLVIGQMIGKIHRLSIEDPLTKTFNRRHITQLASLEIKKLGKKESEFSIIMLDIDHFKKVNDIYGHAAGDTVLVQCSEVLRQCVRGTDYVGRLGGEEFCLMLPDTTIEEAKVLAERVRVALEGTVVQWEDKTIPITASFGVSSLIRTDEWSSLLNKADVAMYQAKNNGRNQVVTA